MESSTQGLESQSRPAFPLPAARPAFIPLDRLNLEDDRILSDIETEMAARLSMESKVENPATRTIPRFLLEGRTLGPLSVLLILVLYSLLSPLLSPAIHEYISRILH
jgi:hypothetical protein